MDERIAGLGSVCLFHFTPWGDPTGAELPFMRMSSAASIVYTCPDVLPCPPVMGRVRQDCSQADASSKSRVCLLHPAGMDEPIAGLGSVPCRVTCALPFHFTPWGDPTGVVRVVLAMLVLRVV